MFDFIVPKTYKHQVAIEGMFVQNGNGNAGRDWTRPVRAF